MEYTPISAIRKRNFQRAPGFLSLFWTLARQNDSFLSPVGHPHGPAFLALAAGTLVAFLEAGVAARLYLHFCTWGPQSNERRRRNF